MTIVRRPCPLGYVTGYLFLRVNEHGLEAMTLRICDKLPVKSRFGGHNLSICDMLPVPEGHI
jgi:hypothetical protein